MRLVRRLAAGALLLLACGTACISARAGEATCRPPAAPPSAAEARRFAEQAPDRGFLWKITRDGHSSYLFGTLHLGRAGWPYPGPSLRKAWHETDVLALELDLSDPDTARRLAQGMASRTGPQLPEDLARRLRQAMEASCLPPQAARVHPSLQVTLLSLEQAHRQGLDVAFAQESMLDAMASRDHRHETGLETVEDQLALILPEDAEEAASEVASTLDQMADDPQGRLVSRLAGDWERGDLQDLSAYEQWCECARDEQERAALKRLNDDRNPPLAEAIARLHGEGHRVLAAVGALHMVGPQGLPRLLAGQGFRVERIAAPR